MRDWMNDRPSYIPPVALGEVMRALALGRVLVSKNPKFAAGDLPGFDETTTVTEGESMRFNW